MSSLEQKINTYLDVNRSKLDKKSWMIYDVEEQKLLNEPGSAVCARGVLSVLKVLYGLNVEENTVACCFRAESGLEAGGSSHSYDWDRQTMGGKLKDAIRAMMDCISGAVNHINGYERYKSYSKCLAAPLFKYYRRSYLEITLLKLNTFALNMYVDCFDWNGEGDTSYDNYGNEHDRYHQEILEMELPMRKISSAEAMYATMWEFLEGNLPTAYAVDEDGCRDYLMDIDDVDFEITGFTMDISQISRRDLDFYYDEELMYGYKFKRHASYRKDREVISTEPGIPLGTIHTPNALALVRFLYLLRISGQSGKFDNVAADLVNGGYPEMLLLDSRERETVAWIADNLKGGWLREEQAAYHEVFNGLNSHGQFAFSQHFDMYRGGSELSELLQRLAVIPGFFPDSAFLAWMKEKAGIR